MTFIALFDNVLVDKTHSYRYHGYKQWKTNMKTDSSMLVSNVKDDQIDNSLVIEIVVDTVTDMWLIMTSTITRA